MAHPPHSPGFLALVKDAKSRVREFTIEEYRARLARGEAWVLIDTREDHEWEAGHLPDAIHIATARREACTGFVTNDQRLSRASPIPVLLLTEILES